MLSRNAVTIFVVAVAEFFVSSRVFGAVGFGFGLLGALALSALGVFILRRNLRRIPGALQDFINPLAATNAAPGATSSSDVATKLGLNAVGALLLIIPGFLTAALGAVMFLPPVRSLAGPAVQKRMQAFQPLSSAGGAQPFDLFDRVRQAGRRADPNVVDVEVVHDDPTDRDVRSTRPELH